MILFTTSATSKRIVNKAIKYRLAIFLVICYIFGGTSQLVSTPKIPIYVFSLVMIGFAFHYRHYKRRLYTAPFIWLVLFFIIHLIYLVPLPPELWRALPGRDIVVEGFKVLETPLPWLPLSMAPQRTIIASLHFLPIFAVWTTVVLSATRAEIEYAFIVTLALILVSAILGVAQVSIGENSLYFYSISHLTSGTGFFSNSNHQATFLVMLLPFSMTFYYKRKSLQQSAIKPQFISGFFFLVVCAGVFTTKSIAGYFFVLASIVVILLLSRPLLNSKKIDFLWRAALLSCVLLTFLSLFIFGSYRFELVQEVYASHGTSRQTMLKTTLEAALHYFPIGSGPGSFQSVYPMHEAQADITPKFANQAHNEFAQIFLEFGAIGIMIIASGIYILSRFWWKICINKLDNSRLYTEIVSLFVGIAFVFLHSLVDYPLRTITVSTLGAFIFAYVVVNLEYELE